MGTEHTNGSSSASVARRRGAPPAGSRSPADLPTITALPRLADERAYLYGIIRTIGSGPDLHSILSGVVRLTTEATQCHACLIWFLEGERFVLRASSEPYASLSGSISMAMDEGLVGWVAQSRRSAFIEDDALKDPRVKYFPELEEEHFQSLVSVPMFGRDGGVMGVISLHAEAPHEFAHDDLEFLEHTASLIAGAVENARSYEDSTARVDLLTDLSRLSRRIAAASEIDELLSAVGPGTRGLLSASVCEIYLTDSDGRLELAAADPPRTTRRLIDPDVLPTDQGPAGDPRIEDRLARALWGETPEGTVLFDLLTVGEERLGLLVVVTSAPPPGAGTALSAIAAHTAVAIRQLDLVERLLEKNLVSEFFQALSRRDGQAGRAHALANRLAVDLETPHVVVVVSPWPEDRGGYGTVVWNDIAAKVESSLASRLPGVLFDRTERSIRMLLPVVPPDRPAADIEEVVGPAEMTVLSVGISDPCTSAAGYPAAFDEAAAAAEVGGLLRDGPGVSAFRDLGAYRFVLSSPDLARDLDRQRLDRLVAYDRRRGTRLLDTLERYLDERGNVVGTARALYIHPNTLRQRLERIERESGLDLERDDWLSLAIAVKVVRLEQMRERSDDGRGTHGG